MKNMFVVHLLFVFSTSFAVGCNDLKVDDPGKNNAAPASTSATVQQSTIEMQQPTVQAVAEDNTTTTTSVDVEKASPSALPKVESIDKNATMPVVAIEKDNKQNASAPATTTVVGHEAFNAMLQKFVSASGTVNYAGWKKSEADLDKYLATLAAAIPAGTAAKNEALAYWINAYNAFTVKLILKNYPVASITDLNSGKPWDVQWITLAGKKYSLNDIENKVIRPTFKEPRIHFAVNCAAKSCPPLANKAFTADNLNSMLEQRTKSFINSSLNTITSDKVTISKIFDWYKEDFGNVISFINKYAATDASPKATIAYNDYNWALNK